VLLSLGQPLYVVNTGDDPADARSAAISPSGASLGDLRIGARVQLFGERRGSVAISIGNYVWLPVGEPTQYAGDEGARSMPHVAVGGTLQSFVYAAYLGVRIRRPVEVLDVGVGSELGGGLAGGVEVLARRLMIGAELMGSTGISGSARGRDVQPFDESTSYAEVHACSRLELQGAWFGIAAGPGLTDGVGTPVFRAMATLGGALALARMRTSRPERESARAQGSD
jgi:hypothetical protein